MERQARRERPLAEAADIEDRPQGGAHGLFASFFAALRAALREALREALRAAARERGPASFPVAQGLSILGRELLADLLHDFFSDAVAHELNIASIVVGRDTKQGLDGHPGCMATANTAHA